MLTRTVEKSLQNFVSPRFWVSCFVAAAFLAVVVLVGDVELLSLIGVATLLLSGVLSYVVGRVISRSKCSGGT